jgi:hypothetical protein
VPHLGKEVQWNREDVEMAFVTCPGMQQNPNNHMVQQPKKTTSVNLYSTLLIPEYTAEYHLEPVSGTFHPTSIRSILMLFSYISVHDPSA